MKNTKKIFLLLMGILIALIFAPSICQAKTTDVSSTSDLKNAISEAEDGDIIKLTTDIALTEPIEVNGKDITINGSGFTISRNASDWHTDSANGTLITAGGAGTDLTLTNLNLRNSAKYGAQAYNQGHLILDGVTVGNCAYGGILVNGGILEIKNLTLYKNRETDNSGIEIGRSSTVSSVPRLIMNGTLTSTESDNVIYFAENDSLDEFEFENSDDTKNKVLMSGKQLVVTDEENNILYTSNENDKVQIEGDEYVPNVIVTVYLMEQSITLSVQPGTTISKEDVQSEIDLEKLNLSNYTVNGFYSDEKYTTEFDFSKPISSNTSIYAKLTLNDNNNNATTTPEPEKDNSPKTGVENYLGLAVFTMVASGMAIAILRRKEA